MTTPSNDRNQIVYYAASSGVLPDAHRFPWDRVGAGGSLDPKGVIVTGTTARAGYRRHAARARERDRLELQADFTGALNNPAWASGAPGNVLWIDDGHRAFGVAIGTRLEVVDPATGAILAETPDASQPGGWTTRRNYQVIKVDTSWWEVWCDGRRVVQFPYFAAASSTTGTATFGWGWQDAAGSGRGTWDRVEYGVAETLAPNWIVDRTHYTMPPAIQLAWNARHEAWLRATLGLAATARDDMARAADQFTAAVGDVQRFEFAGDLAPDDPTLGWTLTGDAPTIVRSRVRFPAGNVDSYAEAAFATPVQSDAVYYAAARFTVRDFERHNDSQRIGPYVMVKDGTRQIGAFLIAHRANDADIGWILADGSPGGALGNTGDTLYRVDPFQPSLVEIYVVGGRRVLLFVNGALVEDVPYTRFTTTTAAFAVRVGRDGSPDETQCAVDVQDAAAAIRNGDNARRPLFERRIAERLVFAAGCERNDVLDAWLRHRGGVFAARGTDRLISEVRRVSCDDDAEMVVTRRPGDWFLGVTYPGITPVFLSADTELTDTAVEYHAQAPNFTPQALGELIRRYLLPASAIESRMAAHLVTTLVTDTTTGTLIEDGATVVRTSFDVESTRGFAVGDPVTLRDVVEGTLLTVSFDPGLPGAAVEAMPVTVDRDGVAAARYQLEFAGAAGTEITGTFDLAGKLTDKLADVTSGATLNFQSPVGGATVTAQAFGLDLGGNPQVETFRVVGTAVSHGVKTWSQVHGVTCIPTAQHALNCIDALAPATLYQIPSGQHVSGAYLFDPPLLHGPNTFSLVASGATSAKLLVWGYPEGGADQGEKVTLNGTTPVTTAKTWAGTRVYAMGYVSAARTVRFTALAVDPAAVVNVVSSDAGDTARARLYAVDLDGNAVVRDEPLNGTTPVSLGGGYSRVCGIELGEAATGTVTASQTSDAGIVVSVASFTPGDVAKGVQRRRLVTRGAVAATIDSDVVSARPVVIAGYDEDGNDVADAVWLQTASVFPTPTAQDWSEIRAIATGGIPAARTVDLFAVAWRFATYRSTIRGLGTAYAWTCTGPTDLALDGALVEADVAGDASAAPVDLVGTWSASEDSEITSLDEDTVRVLPLTGSFLAGSILRRDV